MRHTYPSKRLVCSSAGKRQMTVDQMSHMIDYKVGHCQYSKGYSHFKAMSGCHTLLHDMHTRITAINRQGPHQDLTRHHALTC